MKKIIYRTDEFYERSPGTKFDQMSIEYKLDDEIKNVVPVGKIDDQAIIQSYEECALDKILDKYLDQINVGAVKVVHDDVNVYDSYQPDIMDLAEEYERVNALRDKYGLSDSLSIKEVLDEIGKKKSLLESKIFNSMKEVEDEKTQEDKQKNE